MVRFPLLKEPPLIDIILVGYSVCQYVGLQTLNIAKIENWQNTSVPHLSMLAGELRVVSGVEFFLLKLVVDNMKILLKLEIHTDSQDCEDPSKRQKFVLLLLLFYSLDNLYKIQCYILF